MIASLRTILSVTTRTFGGWSTLKSRGNAETEFDISFSTIRDLLLLPKAKVKARPPRRPRKGSVSRGGVMALARRAKPVGTSTLKIPLLRAVPRRNTREMRSAVASGPERANVPETVASSNIRGLASFG
jgi:hypothetical protein